MLTSAAKVKYYRRRETLQAVQWYLLHDQAEFMAEIVNLRRFKKRAAREQSAQQAETNRARFGRTKPERALDAKLAARTSNLLDQHRLDSEDAS